MTLITKSESFSEKVIVRAYHDEPVRLTATGWRDDATLEVRGSDPHRSIGWCAGDAYRFSESLYNDLRRAYEDDDRHRLEELWARAIPFANASETERAAATLS